MPSLDSHASLPPLGPCGPVVGVGSRERAGSLAPETLLGVYQLRAPDQAPVWGADPSALGEPQGCHPYTPRSSPPVCRCPGSRALNYTRDLADSSERAPSCLFDRRGDSLAKRRHQPWSFHLSASSSSWPGPPGVPRLSKLGLHCSQKEMCDPKLNEPGSSDWAVRLAALDSHGSLPPYPHPDTHEPAL